MAKKSRKSRSRQQVKVQAKHEGLRRMGATDIIFGALLTFAGLCVLFVPLSETLMKIVGFVVVVLGINLISFGLGDYLNSL